jgi:hypothetical protein
VKHYIPHLAYGLLGTGLALGILGILGIFGRNDDVMRCGILLTVVAVPLVVIHALRAERRFIDERLSASHTAGYRLALDHVARGLLDQASTAPTGPGHRADTSEEPDNVITLFPISQLQERKAAL